MRRILTAAAVAVGLGASMLGATSVAAAPAASAASDGGTAPACIKRYVTDRDGTQGWYVIVQNDCGKTMRVKVYGNLSWQESACHTLRPGQSFKHNENHFGRYRKTVVC
jgi:hypothetical protein